MRKVKLIKTITKGTAVRKYVDPYLIISDEAGEFMPGDILDANNTLHAIKDATVEYDDTWIHEAFDSVDDKINAVVGDAPEWLDTLSELAEHFDEFYTKTQVDSIITNTSSQFYTKTAVDDIVSGILNTHYTKTEVDNIVNTKANDYYTKTLVDDIAADKLDIAAFEQFLLDQDGGCYGIKSVNGGAPVRIGSMNSHRALPILNMMRRCLVKDGVVRGYIDPNDYTKYTDGTDVDYTGGDGDVMVEIPEYYFDSYRYTDNDNNTVDILLLYPYTKNHTKSKKVYIGAFEAASDGTGLSSICTTNFTVSNNTVDMSELTYTDNAATYRGGNKDTTHDEDIKSLLGRPISNLTRAAFRTRAAAKGTGYSQQYWDAYMAAVRLYVVEYASFNSQAMFNPSTTADGYKQGGLGPGFTNASSSEWSDFNGYYPLCPCGITKSLVNNTNIINVTYPAGSLGTSARTFSVPSYRGIENPFGHIWKWTDGININTVNNVTTVYTTNNITSFADNTATGYTQRASFAKPSNGYIKTWNWDEYGDFIPTAIGGSDHTYLCDCSYWNYGWRVLYSGGAAYDVAYCGWFCFYADYGSGGASAIIGGRLYFTPTE